MIDPEIGDVPLATTDRILRQFAVLSILIFGGMACWQGLIRHHQMLGLVFAALAILIGPLGLVKPQAIRPVFLGMMAMAVPIGWLVSHLALALLFFGVFTPVALFFKLIGRDVLTRRRRPQAPTYWTDHPAPRDVHSYFRQS